MVVGDFVSGVPASVYQGVFGVFLVTNFWDPSSMGKEYEQSVPVIDAAFEGMFHSFSSFFRTEVAFIYYSYFDGIRSTFNIFFLSSFTYGL